MTKGQVSVDTFNRRVWVQIPVLGESAVSMITRLAALAAIAFFLVTAFRSGWRRAETDFPNYYTAAVCMRKGLPVREYYDWTWFQRQMNYAGIERQLGGYQPQTPLTALPLVPLSWSTPQRAKQIWLVCNLIFLGTTIWMLTLITGVRGEQMVLLSFLGFGSLYSNFLYGQYYVFLLFLLTLTFYFLDRRKTTASGVVAGLAFALKLYSGPLLLYFVVKCNWRAVAGFAVAVTGAIGLAIALFGWGDVAFYATRILPRALEGEIIDPYNSGNGTMATLLRRLFVLEPELNPQPVWNAPIAFFFLRPLVSLLIIGVTLLGIASNRAGIERRDFGWLLVTTLLLSANTASYTFILMLLPISLLLVDADMGERIFLVGSFFALCFPLRPGWSSVFPRLWILLAVYFVVGWPYLKSIHLKRAAGLVAASALLAAASARGRAVSWAVEPGQRWERVATEKGALFSSSPAVTRAGLFYQSIGEDRYVLGWLHDGKIEKLIFEGHAFQPVAASPEGPIYFELVAHGKSTTIALDPATRQVGEVAAAGRNSDGNSAWSPDGKWLAFESVESGAQQIRLRNVANGVQQGLTSGNCNSWAPAWELDSKAVIFASDCGRGIGLPALYRASVAEP
jgi:hypothetical protein